VSLSIPSRKDFKGTLKAETFLFCLDGIHCFLADECMVPDDPGFIYKEINFFRSIQEKEIAWASIVAMQLMNWYQQNRYCGKCGAVLSPKQDERALECINCGNAVYPKISPAVIVAILSRDRILLAKGVNFRLGFHSLIAGYADIGESLEETVAREVKEEVGLDVTNIRYYKSQPWPVSGTMMVGFIAEADDSVPIKIDPREISEAAWFSRDNLPKYPSSAISIAGEMIEKWCLGEL
jgi:NAD+ diphosphatase